MNPFPENARAIARRVLVFNSLKRFVAVFGSQVQAAKAFGVKSPSLKAACDGKSISCKGYYFRWWDDMIEIDINKEFGTLNLMDYDELCGETSRKYYATKAMNRVGMKYNMIQTPEKMQQSQKRHEREAKKRAGGESGEQV